MTVTHSLCRDFILYFFDIIYIFLFWCSESGQISNSSYKLNFRFSKHIRVIIMVFLLKA